MQSRSSLSVHAEEIRHLMAAPRASGVLDFAIDAASATFRFSALPATLSEMLELGPEREPDISVSKQRESRCSGLTLRSTDGPVRGCVLVAVGAARRLACNVRPHSDVTMTDFTKRERQQLRRTGWGRSV